MNQLLKSPWQPHRAEKEAGNTERSLFPYVGCGRRCRPFEERNLAPKLATTTDFGAML